MDVSILERGGSPHIGLQGIALGRITRVDPVQRFCQVKTFFGPHPFNDMHISRCQWLAQDANPEGDESTSIPRVGSTGLVFIVEGEAFIFGYFRATDPEKGAVTGEEQADLNEGDKIIATIGQNRVIIRANGAIEIQSKETLKTIYFPKTGALSDICSAYAMKADGGKINWKSLNELNETLYSQEFRRDMARSTIIVEEKGRVTDTVVRRITMGPGLPGEESIQFPLYTEELDITGKLSTTIGIAEAGITYEVNPDGGAKFANVLSSVELTPEGDFKFKLPTSELNMLASGDFNLKNASGAFDLLKDGAYKISNQVAELSCTADGTILIKNPTGTIEITKDGDASLKLPASEVTLSKAGDIDVKNQAGAFFSANASGQFNMGNSQFKLMDQIIQVLDAFINQPNLTMTSTGPSGPLLPPALATLTTIKALASSSKV